MQLKANTTGLYFYYIHRSTFQQSLWPI